MPALDARALSIVVLPLLLGPSCGPDRVSRPHSGEVDGEDRLLVSHRVVERDARPWDPVPVTAGEAAADLDQLEWIMEHRWSYLGLVSFDHERVLDSIRASLAPEVDPAWLGLALDRMLRRSGDGHAGADVGPSIPPEYLPCFLTEVGERVTALRIAGGEARLLVEGHPALAAIDGVPLDRWMEVSTALAGHRSPQWTRTYAVGLLHAVGLLRDALALPRKESVVLALESAGGTKVRRLDVAVSSQPPTGVVPYPLDDGVRTTPDGLGYLRLRRMDGRGTFQSWLLESMRHLASARGLVIDVRGNGGGSRLPLLTLAPWFVGEDESPLVANVAAYRFSERELRDRPDGYLEDRFLWPASSWRWSAAQREAIARVAERFEPEWRPEGAFSAWHYLVLERGDETYDGPVVVLQDAGCFSATDIFLGAFAELSGVTLMGTPSGGGSGRTRRYELSHSGIHVRLSTMASFRPGGRLYDGRGIAPDVTAAPTLDDMLHRDRDSVLERAFELLRERLAAR